MSGRMDANRVGGRRGRARGRGVLGRLGLAASLIAGLTVTAVVAVTPLTAVAADPVVSFVRPTLQSSDPIGIAMSADGVIWNIGPTTGPLWRIEPASFPSFGRPNPLNDITLGPDGSLWVTESGDCVAGRGCITKVFGPSASPGVTPFADPTIVEPQGIITGPDNSLWFTNENTVAGTHSIGRITVTGAISSFPVTLPSGGRLNSITAGPDGNLWFTNEGTGSTFSNSSIGRITPAGTVTLFTDPLIVNPQGITTGPDGNLWFTNLAGNSIGTITTNGAVTRFTAPSISGPVDIVSVADGALWFTNSTGNSIGRITTAGAVASYTDASVSRPWSITQGPGGDLFFTNRTTRAIGRVDLPSYTVNSTGDGNDVTPGDDVCLTATAGECTLRAAIQEANAHAGRDLITFDIAGGGLQTISVTSFEPGQTGAYHAALPPITDPVTIDGFTQPGALRNASIVGDTAVRTIRIANAASSPCSAYPLAFDLRAGADGSAIRGLELTGWSFVDVSCSAGVPTGVILAFVGKGIRSSVADTVIQGNSISGGPTLGGAVDLSGPRGVIGGSDPAAHNTLTSLGLSAGADDAVISGNVISGGTYYSSLIGITGTTGVLVGGTAPGAGNVVCEAGFYGTELTESGNTGLRFLGNRFGTNAAGAASCWFSPFSAMSLGSAGTVFGDGTPRGGNLVSGVASDPGTRAAITVTGAGVIIKGNTFGLNAAGTGPLANTTAAVNLAGTNIQFGGLLPGEGNVVTNSGNATDRPAVIVSGTGSVVAGNTITGNPGIGVRVETGSGNRVVRNIISSNGGAGIVLGTALTSPADDVDDADAGPNNLQNSPQIISADLAAGELLITVSIDSAPANATAPIEIDFYEADSPVSGEGQRYIGSATLPVTPGGQTLSLGFLTGVVAGASIVATATDANGNTSPFSAAATLAGPVAPTISLAFGVASGSGNTVSIAPTGVRVADLDRTAIAGAGGAGAIASSSITSIGPEDTALAEISIGSTPLRAVVLNSAPLRAVSLVDIVVNPPGGGGWTSLLAGTPLENVPLVNLTFGDALSNPIVEGKIAALPLRAVEVEGTPLRAVPLAAIVLGSTPLRGVPLRAVASGQPNPWCAVIAALLVAPQTCEQALDTLNLMEVALRGAPLRGVDLSSIPLRGVDLAGTPLRGVPLRGVDLGASPLRGVPLRGVDLNAADVNPANLNAVPLRGVRLNAVPLRGVPLRAVDLQTAPLRGVTLNPPDPQASPLRGVLVEGLSVDGAPLRGVPLRGVPLRGVDLETSPLLGVPLRGVPLRGVPLNAINIAQSPLAAIPLRGVDLVGSPLAAIPLRGVDLAQSPLRGVPLRGVPLRGVPLRGVPIGALTLGLTPLRGVPLRGVDVLSSPLRGVPLRGVTVPGAINCALVDCVKGTLGDAVLAGAVSTTSTLGDIIDATSGIRLGDIAPYFRDFTAAQLAAALANSALTFGDLVTLDDMVLGDLPLDQPDFANLVLRDLGNATSRATLSDLIGAVNPAGGRFTESQLQTFLNGWHVTIGQLTDPGNLTMGDVFDASTLPVYLSDLGSLLDYLNVDQLDALVPGLRDQVRTMTQTLGDLTAQQLGRMTLGDLGAAAGDVTIGTLLAGLGGLLDQYTLGDLLLALVDPGSLAYGGVEFDSFDEKSLPPGTVGAARFDASFTLGGAGTQNVTVEVALPSSATYVPGTAVVGATPQEPTQVGQMLVWSLIANAGATPVPVRFDVLPALRLGPTSLTATVRVLGTGVSATSTATVTVAEGTEPNDFRLVTGSTTARQTTPALEDVAYLTYIPTATDIDVYEITLAENDRLVAQLSNLDADLDMVVWGRPANAAAAAALSPVSAEAPLVPITDPDADGADASVINDFVRLDALDPTLRLIASSNTSGTTDETISTDRLPAGRYFVQVYGANGATNVAPASLQLKIRPGDALPPCRATGPLPARVGTPSAPTIPASANTLILTNETRMQQLHGATERANVTAATNRLTAYLAANPQLGVNPVVVPVDAYSAVRNAYDTWDAAPGSCDPDAANAVVAAINTSIIDPARSQFQHIVFLGGDDLIPMARIADGTTVANEYDFRNEFDGILAGGAGRNAVSAPFWESMIRSDEPYGDAAARRSGDGYLYVSDAALGRVVETPSEIVDALDTFVRFGGNLSIETATVLGYDFLADGSEEVADELSVAPLTVDRALASGRNAGGALWDKTDATAKLQAAGTRALVSLNAHFDYYRALPAVGDQVPGFDDNLIATAVETALGPDALEQSLVFSMGCHSGLSVSDVLVGSPNSDWAQTLGRQGSLLVGNTGFGYGDTEAVAYTEELMRLFADRVTSPFALPLGPSSSSSTVGQALTWAKNDFVAGLQSYSVYDKKAVMESTFYGLPFYRVGLTPAVLPPTPTRTAGPDDTGTSTSRVLATPTNATVTTPSGTYPANVDAASNELVIVAPGRPIQPRLVQDISVVSPTDSRSLAQVAHGAIVEDMTSTYTGVPNPVIATPVFDASASRPEPDAGDVAFPTKPLEITTSTGPSGQRQQLVLATGQYRSDTSVQRLDSNLDVVVYYAPPAVTDFAAPTIGAVDSQIASGRLSISTTVTDAARVDRVYVLVVQNPGFGPATWTGIDLVRSGSTDRWTGSLLLAPTTTDVEFIVQAKDSAGNVGFATNKARNFDVDQPVAPPTPPPAQVLTAAAATAPGATGIYGGTVEIVVASNAAATYSVDGATPVPVPTSGRFPITGEGFHTWEVNVASGYAITGSVVIDTSPPVVSADRASGAVQLNTPVTLRAGDAGSAVTSINYSATGANPIASTTVNATSASLVLTTSGVTTVTVVATDAVGNASAPRSFTYTVDGTPPVVTGTPSTSANAAGWRNGPFQVTWTVDDPSATVPPPSSVTTEGVAQVITSGPSCDAAGNCATGTVTVKVDLTPPAATIATNPAANAADWNRAPVTVSVTCGLDLSGVVCPSPTVVSVDGANQTVAVSVVDAADNVTSLVSRVINLDQVPPVVTWTAPVSGATVSGATYVRPTCQVTDALSGPNGVCTLDIPEPVTTTPGRAVYTATAVGTDRAGNTTTLTSTYTVLTDERGPDIDVVANPASNVAGWWRSAVTFTFTCTDPTGVASCPASRTVSAQGANQSFSVTATDLAGNGTPITVSAINIDLTAPTLTVTAPTSVGPLDTVTITCAASDALSGVATASCVDRTFAASTLTPGANTFTFSATDVAGNVATTTLTIMLVIPPNSAPTVRADMGIAGLEEIGFQTNVVVINGTFSDPGGPGPFTASVRWVAGGAFTPLVLNNNSEFVAAFIYGSAGTRTATVRICDAGGACGTDDVVVRTSVTQRITPVRQCVVDRGASASPRYQARWGYDNPAPFAIAVPSIPILENTFTSVPYLRGQPQILLPGSRRDVFTTTFASGTSAWRINGNTASALSSSPRC